MAEGGFDPPLPQVCRYFIHGACNKGDRCRFSHDRSGAVPTDNVCKYYLAGCCHYGSKCRYDHVKSRDPDPVDLPKKQRGKQSSWGERNVSLPEARESNMVTLTKGGRGNSKNRDASPPPPSKQGRSRGAKQNSRGFNSRAKTFIPGKKYHGSGQGYANAVQGEEEDVRWELVSQDWKSGEWRSRPYGAAKDKDLLCPYFAHGSCPYMDECSYAHGDICDMCNMPRLHPTDTAQREQHEKECLQQHEQDMERSFQVQAGQDKECGICLDKIMDKGEENGITLDNRFGILENCNHAFCLTCIKEWRANRSADKTAHRSCPVCRTESKFVTPSQLWVEEPEEKKKMIDTYLTSLSKKHCRNFKRGKGKCPFGNSCHFLHAYPDGTIASPEPVKKPRRRFGQDGEIEGFHDPEFWDFFRLRSETQERLLRLGESLPDDLGDTAQALIFSAIHNHDGDLDPDILANLEDDIRALTFEFDWISETSSSDSDDY